MPASIEEKYKRFRALHFMDHAFVMANPWDAGTARILGALGFEALATTSAGYAFSVGKRDSCAALARSEILANARSIVEATELPVSADLEDGFDASPEECAHTIELASGAGLVGGSIEDATGDSDDLIHEFGFAVERILAAAEVAKNRPFMLTARAENYLWGRPNIDDTIKRLQAFSEAGADVLYAPGLPDLETIHTVCREVDKPVNVVVGLQGANHTVEALAGAGVNRISVGGSFARAALDAMIRAAVEARDNGTFTYASDAIPDREVSAMMTEAKRSDRV